MIQPPLSEGQDESHCYFHKVIMYLMEIAPFMSLMQPKAHGKCWFGRSVANLVR
jgi:hypothetical protein